MNRERQVKIEQPYKEFLFKIEKSNEKKDPVNIELFYDKIEQLTSKSDFKDIEISRLRVWFLPTFPHPIQIHFGDVIDWGCEFVGRENETF